MSQKKRLSAIMGAPIQTDVASPAHPDSSTAYPL